ncbi:hypothetical protein [Streptosporangium roseum]
MVEIRADSGSAEPWAEPSVRVADHDTWKVPIRAPAVFALPDHHPLP